MKKIVFFILLMLTILIYSVNGQGFQKDEILADSTKSEQNEPFNKKALIFANDFIFSISLTYEQIFSLKNNWHLALRAGPAYTAESGDDLAFEGQASFLAGKSIHFFETGVGYYHNLTYPDAFVLPLIGYRYMGRKGLLVKVYGDFMLDVVDDSEWGFCNPGFHIAIGYRINLDKHNRN